MLLPVIERFAELGWQAFVEPGETYELFSVSGIFKRAHIDTTATTGSAASAALVQRHALFDVCLSSGLAHLIVSYVGATHPSATASGSNDVAVGGTHYVLKEPIAVQQWLRRRVDALEKAVQSEVAAFGAHVGHGHKPKKSTASFDSHVRELSGLRAVATALVERLKEAAHQLQANAHSQRPEELLKHTELARLTNEGIQHLLEMLFRVQSATLTSQCLQWLQERSIVFDADQYHEFYYQARSARASLRQSLEGAYEVSLSSISNSDIAFPSLLIELVIQNAAAAQQLSLPPSSVADLLQLLQSPAVHAEMVAFYSDEIRHEPVEGFFRVQTALLLYFALDMAYVSVSQGHSRSHTKNHAWTGAELVSYFTDIAESFAAQLGVPDDMKATLLAIWLIENAVNVRLASNEEVAPIYHGAVTLLLESSAMHLQRKAGLEAELILYMVETLVHRSESSFAWKIWTAYEMELSQLPPVAAEYMVIVNLELGAWERALSLLRHERRLDLLELVFKWLVKYNRVKDLVHHTTLTREEEQLFEEFMMGGRFLGDSVLQDVSIRKADLLVMYYVLRNQFDKAWAMHHEHLALIRESSAGNTNVAQAVLHQPSFRIRSALLENMKPEPTTTAQERAYSFKRSFRPTRPMDTDVMMIGSGGMPVLQLPETSASEDDDRMSDDTPVLASAPTSAAPTTSVSMAQDFDPSGPSATPSKSPFSYSPGIYSSRSSQPRSSSKNASSPFFSDIASTPAPTAQKVTIGSIDASPDAAGARRPTGASKRVVQALNFGVSPVAPRGTNSQVQKPSDRPRSFVSQPVRSAFNSGFASFQSTAPSTSEDLALKPRAEHAVDATPVDVQVGSASAAHDDHSGLGLSGASSIAAAASTASQDLALFATPKRFQFVREPPKSDSRVASKSGPDALRSPATQELEAMELEPIDEEFSTPSAARSRGLLQDPQSTPSRRNPRRQSRTRY